MFTQRRTQSNVVRVGAKLPLSVETFRTVKFEDGAKSLLRSVALRARSDKRRLSYIICQLGFVIRVLFEDAREHCASRIFRKKLLNGLRLVSFKKK